MKRIIIIHSGESAVGGIANATIFYAASLRAAGFEAEVWTPVKELAARCEKFGIQFFHHAWLESAGLSMVSPKIARRALEARKSAAAVIHQGAKLWLFGRLWLRGIPESVVFHNEKIGQRRYFRRWLAISDRRCAELEAYARSRRYRKVVRVIRNGPLPDASRKTLRTGEIRTIGCMGNFGSKKAVHVLVQAFAGLIARGYDIRLILAGDGAERGPCQELARKLGVADRISWPGWLTETRTFFESIDLFALPSIDEPFGIVIAEAMQAGLPVIATHTKGPSEIVIPGKTGWLAPPGDAGALASAMEDAVRNPIEARSLGANGYERFLGAYSLPAAGKLLADALR